MARRLCMRRRRHIAIGRAESRCGTGIAVYGCTPAFEFVNNGTPKLASAEPSSNQMGRKAARRLGSWLILLGVIGIIASIIWWQSFYGGVIGEPSVDCLYRLSGPCQMVSNVASFFGAASYDPRLLWASGILAVVGLFLQR